MVAHQRPQEDAPHEFDITAVQYIHLPIRLCAKIYREEGGRRTGKHGHRNNQQSSVQGTVPTIG